MNTRKLVLSLLLILPMALVGSGSALAKGDNAAQAFIAPQVVDLAFSFQVGIKTLPAGRYTIEQRARDVLTFVPAKGLEIEVPVITRIAQPPAPVAQSKVVFDHAEDMYYLSELWIPGLDGFLLGYAEQVHTHKIVNAAKK